MALARLPAARFDKDPPAPFLPGLPLARVGDSSSVPDLELPNDREEAEVGGSIMSTCRAMSEPVRRRVFRPNRMASGSNSDSLDSEDESDISPASYLDRPARLAEAVR